MLTSKFYWPAMTTRLTRDNHPPRTSHATPPKGMNRPLTVAGEGRGGDGVKGRKREVKHGCHALPNVSPSPLFLFPLHVLLQFPFSTYSISPLKLLLPFLTSSCHLLPHSTLCCPFTPSFSSFLHAFSHLPFSFPQPHPFLLSQSLLCFCSLRLPYLPSLPARKTLSFLPPNNLSFKLSPSFPSLQVLPPFSHSLCYVFSPSLSPLVPPLKTLPPSFHPVSISQPLFSSSTTFPHYLLHLYSLPSSFHPPFMSFPSLSLHFTPRFYPFSIPPCLPPTLSPLHLPNMQHTCNTDCTRSRYCTLHDVQKNPLYYSQRQKFRRCHQEINEILARLAFRAEFISFLCVYMDQIWLFGNL